MATLRLEIVTPEGRAFPAKDAGGSPDAGDVDMVTIPGAEGELGIMPQHAPLLTGIKPGELRVLKNGKETFLAVGEGFVEVTQERVIVFTDMALEGAHIDEAAAQAAFDKAQEALKAQRLSDEEHATVQASLEKSIAQLMIVKRRKQGH
ncbi:MAG TPA: ATP synthase F1 subunit epsilon [Chthoniobacteraceae bacterium]|nr:ATP synthase F1 subunit epsilon [Chthoniobacteraceae bacterium]